MTTPVLSVVATRFNADLIAEVAKLWIPADADILGATYGEGLWWSRALPHPFATNDLDPTKDTHYHHDFRDFPPSWDGLFDVVFFDPPYVSKGGRDTSGIKDMDALYGLYDAPKDPAALWYFIESGIASCARCLKRRGRLLVKCSDFISSGKYQNGYLEVCQRAVKWGLTHVDTFIHHSGTGPQPTKNRDGSPRRQVHSRRAHSYLVVFEK